jgi:RNA polymerase sigma-70 factor, ECF subfamily
VGIFSPAGESSPHGLSRDTLEERLDPSELERFEAVILPHLNAAYGLARSLLRNDADAEDVVQEAYLRAFRYFGGFHGAAVGQGRAWVLTIVRNTASTWRRRHRADASATEFDETLHSEATAGEHPGTDLARSGTRETLAQALDRLSPDLREVILLREVEGLSYKEIGDVTEVPIGTVMSRLSRARKRLQAALAASGKES